MENEEKPVIDRLPDGKWAPGVSGNPNGRPKRKSFADYFDEQETEDLINTVKQALKDRPEILKMTVEQLFGKPRQNIGLDGGEEGKPIAYQDLTDEQLDERIKRLQNQVLGTAGSEATKD